MARIKNATRPEVGTQAPEFNLPSAQGGSLRLGVRTVRGPVIVAFFRGAWSEEDVGFFKALAGVEDEVNAALGSIVGVGVCEPEAAREFQRAVGLKSYVLYDYTKTAVPEWGVFTEGAEHGSQALPSTFIVDTEHKVSSAWPDARPTTDELLSAVTALTGLPREKEPEDDEPEKDAKPEDGPADKTAGERRPRSKKGREPGEKRDGETDDSDDLEEGGG